MISGLIEIYLKSSKFVMLGPYLQNLEFVTTGSSAGKILTTKSYIFYPNTELLFQLYFILMNLLNP